MTENLAPEGDCPNLKCCLYSVAEGCRRGKKVGYQKGLIDGARIFCTIIAILFLIKVILSQ